MTDAANRDSVAGDAPGARGGRGTDKETLDETPEKSEKETLRWLEPQNLSFLWDGGPGPIRLTVREDRSLLHVHASRAFPLSHPQQLVQLFTHGEAGVIGMLEDIGSLANSDRKALEECLRRDRILPEVSHIVSVEERRNLVRWVVETDRGVTSFDMDKVYENVRRQPAGDVMLTDVVGNRYHVIPAELDGTSRGMLERYS